MINVPDDPGAAGPDDVFKAAVRKVCGGDGFGRWQGAAICLGVIR